MSTRKTHAISRFIGCISLILKLIYNAFHRPGAFFTYLTAKKIYGTLRCCCENGYEAAERRLNDLLSGIEYGSMVSSFHGSGQCFHIIGPGHCLFISKLLGKNLERLGISYDIRPESGGLLDIPEEQRNEPHIIICPQIYRGFPRRVFAMQMEQTVSCRWLNESYISILSEAQAVFDYSLSNIEHFGNRDELGGKLFYYLPIDYLEGEAPDSACDEKEIDVLFYGDDSAERRALILDKLKESFKIKVVNNIFGEDMLRLVRKSKIILNIHYYEGALLETTRIYEVLSQNSSLIISERSADLFEDKKLENVVDFVEIGDIDALKARIGYWLSHEDERKAKVKANNELLSSKKSDFSFFFMRALLAENIIDFETFYKHQKDYFDFDGERVCLGLIEKSEGRERFARCPFGFKFFPGLIKKSENTESDPGLRFILRRASDEGLQRLILCNEDLPLPDGFEERLSNAIYSTVRERGARISEKLCVKICSAAKDVSVFDMTQSE